VQRAFRALSTCRQVSMGGVGQIPWTAIRDYAEAHGIEDLEYLEEVIWSMDEAYRAHHHRKQKEATSNE